MRKKLFAIVLCVTVLCCPFAVVSAEGIGDSGTIPITPSYAYTRSTYTGLTISSSGQATASASINGYAGTTTKVTITMTLQKKGLFGLFWTDEETWTQTFNSYSGAMSKTKSVSGGTYRTKAVYVSYSGSASETITSYSSEVKY